MKHYVIISALLIFTQSYSFGQQLESASNQSERRGARSRIGSRWKNLKRGRQLALRSRGALDVGRDLEKNAESLLLPLTLLKEHKGNIEAVQSDPRMVNNLEKTQESFDQLFTGASQAHMLLNGIKPLFESNLAKFTKDLQDPALAPVIGHLSPTLNEIAALIRSLFSKVTTLTEQVGVLKNNPKLKQLLHQEKSEPSLIKQ